MHKLAQSWMDPKEDLLPDADVGVCVKSLFADPPKSCER